MMTRALLPLLLLVATPALAADFVAPQGCSTTLTVQSRGCTVSHFYTCEADPMGNQWRADYGFAGQFYLSMIDNETQWIESYEIDPASGMRSAKETLDAGANDPASFKTLMETGIDTFDFNLTKESGERSHVIGFDKLTGKTALIDGETLQQTEYEFTQTDESGKVLRHSKGQEFISEKYVSFFSGHTDMQAEDGSWISFESAPITFILPGEPGFASTKPLFECDDQMSQLSPSPEEPEHDHL